MSISTNGQLNPFQWYMGKRVVLEGEQYVLEGIDVGGSRLTFRATNLRSREVRHLSLIELLGLEARDACFN